MPRLTNADSHVVTSVEYEPFINGPLVGYLCKVTGIATIDDEEIETYCESFIYLNPSHFDPNDQENTPNVFVYKGISDDIEDGEPLLFIEPFTH